MAIRVWITFVLCLAALSGCARGEASSLLGSDAATLPSGGDGPTSIGVGGGGGGGGAGGGGACPGVSGPPWWMGDWHRRAPLTITNGSSATLASGFQVSWSVDLGALAAGVTDTDLHILGWSTDASQWTELPRVTEPVAAGGAAASMRSVWFQLTDAIAAGAASIGRYWVYFGNTGAKQLTAPGAPQQVFDFYDDFSTGTLDPTAWATQGTVSTTAGELMLGTSSPSTVRTLKTWGSGYAVDFLLRVPALSPRIWAGFQRVADFASDGPWLLWINRSGTTITPEVMTTTIADNGGTYPMWSGPPTTVNATAHLYTVRRLADRVVFGYDGQDVATDSLTQAFSDPLQVRLDNSGQNPIYFDRVRVRHAAVPEPLVQMGATDACP